ncbi:outer membrane beta-barrel protein [Sphingobacterium sp. HJSM2_6]|uniref:outer membrane beta-barrel protein n=1 Tax=Sphingobacterium sp. HJSM2_6 TaxID=3366264 RepID=UPI003BCBC3FB
MRYILAVIIGMLTIQSSNAQEKQWALGFLTDIQFKDSSPYASYGLQGRYDLDNHQSMQAQVYGRGEFIGVGADYLIQFLNKEKSNFNVFLGLGLSQEFFTYESAVEDEQTSPMKIKENFTKAIGQIGVSQYFPTVGLSIYGGFKTKYQFKNEHMDANYLTLGLRYHIW